MSLLPRFAGLATRLIIGAASFWPVRRAARAVFTALTPGRDVKVRFPSYDIYVRTPDRIIAALLCKYSLAASPEAAIYRDRVKPGMTVVEIGANVGFYTLLFSHLTGERGKVLAFEPDQENFRLLEKNAAGGLNNIDCRRAAVADRSGSLRLFISAENRGDHRVYDSGDDRERVEVQAVSVDDVLGPGGKADFIKMDIQGAEFPALLGMERTILGSPGLSMLCEFTPGLMRKCGHSPEAFLAKLRALGFRLSYLDNSAGGPRTASEAELLAMCPGEKYVNLLLERS